MRDKLIYIDFTNNNLLSLNGVGSNKEMEENNEENEKIKQKQLFREQLKNIKQNKNETTTTTTTSLSSSTSSTSSTSISISSSTSTSSCLKIGLFGGNKHLTNINNLKYCKQLIILDVNKHIFKYIIMYKYLYIILSVWMCCVL